MATVITVCLRRLVESLRCQPPVKLCRFCGEHPAQSGYYGCCSYACLASDAHNRGSDLTDLYHENEEEE